MRTAFILVLVVIALILAFALVTYLLSLASEWIIKKLINKNKQ